MSTAALLKTSLTLQTALPLFGENTVAKGTETIGARIARLRRDKGMTQQELARLLNVTQPVVSDYENDVIKVSGETVIQLAQALGSSADEILGLEKSARTNGPMKNRRLYRQLQNIEKLPKRDQQALLRTIDAFLAKAR